MAAGFASFTVFLCLLCFSAISTAVDLPAIDLTNHGPLPKSHTNPDEADNIFLPSDTIESESVPMIESQPEISDPKIPKPHSEVETLKPTESSEASDSVPITMITFRPINRHMPWRPFSFPSRPGHRCRHNHKFKPWNPRLPRHQLPYGNDMILSNGEKKSFDVLPNDRLPKIPMRWTKFGRFEPRFTDEPRHPHHRHEHDHDHDHDDHDHHHDHEHDHKHDHHHDERDHEDGALMKSIRKFLQHF